MARKGKKLPACTCGCEDIMIDKDEDLQGYVIYCSDCGSFPERSFVNPSSARRGWRNFILRLDEGE